MTKFEQNGVNTQFRAFCKEWAVKKFTQSCHICCLHGLQIKCDRCAISVAHEAVISALSTKED